MAEGIGVISRRNNEQGFREQIAHASPDFPDALQRHPQPMKFMPVDELVRLGGPMATAPGNRRGQTKNEAPDA